MSISSLATRALTRSQDYRDLVARSAVALPSAPSGDEEGTKTKVAADGINKLIQYIPTESVTLYVAAMAAAPAIRANWPSITPHTIYWVFGPLTPVLVFLILMRKRKSQGLKAIPSLSIWPWWEMIAALIAFLIWALAVPGGPYMQGQTQGVIAGFLAIFVSTILSLVEPLFAPATA